MAPHSAVTTTHRLIAALCAVWLAAFAAGFSRAGQPEEIAVPSVGSGPVVVGRPSVLPVVDEVGLAATELNRANELRENGSPACVDAYFSAAAGACRYLSSTDVDFELDPRQPIALGVYQESLTGLIAVGQRAGRFNPATGFAARTTAGVFTVPIVYRGFAWQPGDFSELYLAADFSSKKIHRRIANSGIGVPLIVLRIGAKNDPFLRERQPFAATAILKRETAAPGDVSTTGPAERFVLELANPYLIDQTVVGERPARLARDLTAPLAFAEADIPNQAFAAFRQPNEQGFHAKLVMLEPYQPGKIPVIFIHGLLSDPLTWVDSVNELRAQPDIYSRFQFWAFRYPTGDALLESAADLRETLAGIQSSFNAGGADPALAHMVLIGHSMGGLVSQMQVSESSNLMWSQLSNRPFDELQGNPEAIARLGRAVFFHPTPGVERVVYIGTPHRGSALSRRVIGRVGSALVRPSAADAQFVELVESNPVVFGGRTVRRRPTSIDLLEPTSPLLAALARMPTSPWVRLHSIIGTGGMTPLEGPSDGVVTVASAHVDGVDSELFVPARHSELQHNDMTIAELARILRLHASTISEACVQAAGRSPGVSSRAR